MSPAMWSSSTSTGSPTRVCSRSSTPVLRGVAGPAPVGPPSCTVARPRELAVSLPQRDYQLAGRLLARAVTDAEREGIAVGLALGRAARRTGHALGDRARRAAGARPTPTDLLAAATGVLVDCGYEPRTDGTGLVLANCPFHGLAEEYTDLVCGMNLDLLSGLLDGLHHPDLRGPPRTDARAVLRPPPNDRRSSSRVGARVAVLSQRSNDERSCDAGSTRRHDEEVLDPPDTHLEGSHVQGPSRLVRQTAPSAADRLPDRRLRPRGRVRRHLGDRRRGPRVGAGLLARRHVHVHRRRGGVGVRRR